MDSFKETIDFFSADGVALRALVSIGLSRQDQVFDEGADLSGPTNAGSLVPSASGDSALSIATRGGDPSASRQLGADNGLESLRFTGGASLQVSAGVQLNPPTAFVTARSASASAGLSLNISARYSELGPGCGVWGHGFGRSSRHVGRVCRTSDRTRPDQQHGESQPTDDAARYGGHRCRYFQRRQLQPGRRCQ